MSKKEVELGHGTSVICSYSKMTTWINGMYVCMYFII